MFLISVKRMNITAAYVSDHKLILNTLDSVQCPALYSINHQFVMADLWASCVSENKQKHRPDLLFTYRNLVAAG